MIARPLGCAAAGQGGSGGDIVAKTRGEGCSFRDCRWRTGLLSRIQLLSTARWREQKLPFLAAGH